MSPTILGFKAQGFLTRFLDYVCNRNSSEALLFAEKDQPDRTAFAIFHRVIGVRSGYYKEGLGFRLYWALEYHTLILFSLKEPL